MRTSREEAVPDLYESRYDGFVGRRIGEYCTLEGNEGLVLQQVGNKVVHVYQMKHLIPLFEATKQISRWVSKGKQGDKE